MTVTELIEKLKTAPPEANVVLAGCDCEGDCFGAVVLDGNVLLTRGDPLDDEDPDYIGEKWIEDGGHVL